MEASATRVIEELIRYNNWANQQVLEFCKKLDDEQLEATAPGSYGTIRETLYHIVRSEAYYISLLTGDRPLPPFRWEDQPSLGELADYAAVVNAELQETALKVGVADTVVEESDENVWTYQALAVYIQIFNHGIEHRTNITTILNQEGERPPDVDGWAYLSSHEERFEPVT